MPFMQSLPRTTVTYCQYGDSRMKPTDLWGVVPNWQPRPMCKNGASCHVSAPRGSRTGTQGMKNAADRAVVPQELWSSMLDALEVESAPNNACTVTAFGVGMQSVIPLQTSMFQDVPSATIGGR